ncbi:MAG: trigger factor [Candidatus Brocadia sp. AMX2]|uniref:Trigger factor n=1 Tax=Candidatus Brocadia sinica JPN1 TaxID=1197129 RepID=A0ABQ0JTL6_9BACT|nr:MULTISPECIES: trigger factor [Brocadia]MBC6933388.1 trigger factor [Candidatus Brocadia sp.]MBL1170244.1 trigger factor [Candidatus Brocadia sp. AMX1]MCK6469609.1 trigger factor [Candidatus Brocadia sinica]NOG40017.1 trigger factor [Planctomycetota bacterium]KAA0244372.1 MAG: trigger factor [Candidatus Brocadia sp. AMX2]
MNVTIEDAGPCKKVLKFEIPKETIEGEFEKKTIEVCDTVELPGFRKGRAPRKLVEKRFGSQIKDEVKQSVVSDCYQKTLEEQKLSPVGNPKFSEIELEMGKPLTFDVTLEVWPSFEINQYKGLKLKKKPANATDEDVQKVLMDMAFRKAQLTVVKEGTVKKGDHIIGDCKVEVGGNTVFEDDDVEIPVVNGVPVANTTIQDLAAKLENMKSGEECKIDVKLSDNFVKEEYRGKDAKIRLKVKEIKRLIPADIHDDFAKTMGFDSLEDFKSNIRKRIEIDKKKWVEDDLKNQVLDVLLDQTKLELPQDFLNHHTDQRVYKHQLDLLNRGVPLEEIQKQADAIKNASAESVMRELKASLIMNHIAEKEKIFITENEVEQQIADIARSYNTDIARVRKQLERQGNLSYLRNDMRENKVMNFLLKEASIEG